MSVNVQQLVDQVPHLPHDMQDEFLRELLRCFDYRYTEKEAMRQLRQWFG